MATNYVQSGDVLTVPAPAASMKPNDIYQVGGLAGVVVHAFDNALGDLIDVATVGVFELPKVSADVIALGDVVYKSATGLATTTNGGAGRIGVAVEAAGAGVGTVKVKIGG